MRLAALLLALLLPACACRGVIGANYRNRDNRVAYPYRGSPAERLGLQAGDILVEPESLRGLPGEVVTVRWLRDGKEYSGETQLMCVEELDTGWPTTEGKSP